MLPEFVYQCVCISLWFRVFVLLTVPVFAPVGSSYTNTAYVMW